MGKLFWKDATKWGGGKENIRTAVRVRFNNERWMGLVEASTAVDSVKSAYSFSFTEIIRHPLSLKYINDPSTAQTMSVLTKQVDQFPPSRINFPFCTLSCTYYEV